MYSPKNRKLKESKMKKIGVLWKKEKDDKEFYTGILDLGVLGKVNIGIFFQKKSDETDTKPDANIVMFEDKEG
jgi:hypothetical protein